MANISKDSTLTGGATKQRKVVTYLSFNLNSDVIVYHYDVIALDNANNELYTISTKNRATIPSSRMTEALMNTWVASTNNMLRNEL